MPIAVAEWLAEVIIGVCGRRLSRATRAFVTKNFPTVAKSPSEAAEKADNPREG